MAESNRLFNRHFLLLWQGQFVSQLGNQAHAIAMMFGLKHATGSASLMGLIMMLSMLPGVLLGPLAGTIVDNYSRKKIIVIADILSGLFVLLLAAIMLFAPQATRLTVIWLTVVSIALGVIAAVFRPAISASIPDLVPALQVAANGNFRRFLAYEPPETHEGACPA